MAVSLTVCEIFSCTELKNRHFHPLYCDSRPQQRKAQWHQHMLYIAEKYT